MKTVSVDPHQPASEVIEEAAAILEAGGICGLPTETFYGLAVDPFNPEALVRLNELKGKVKGEPVLLLAADIAQVVDRWRVGLARIVRASPVSGEVGVAITRETVLEFDRPLDPATVTPAAFWAQFGGQVLTSTLRHSPAAAGRYRSGEAPGRAPR